MLVQALAEYADRNLSGQLSDEAWEERPVPALIEIGPDGAFYGIVERLRNETRGKKVFAVPQILSVPKSPVLRNSGLHPLLAADDIKYVLGPGAWSATKDEQNVTERHEAFVKLIKLAAVATGDVGLEAAVRFYDRADQVQMARSALSGFKPGMLVALSVNGPLVLRPAVQSYWRDHFLKAFKLRVDSGGIGECLVSGSIGPIAPTHEKIKGVSSLGGQPAGVSLMSFDKSAFRSYGWDQNANSPIAPGRALAYVLALNDLLRVEKGHRRDIAGIGFIFWTRIPEKFDALNILDSPQPEEVAALLRLDRLADPDPNMFYMAGVSGNGARLLVRYWVAESLGRIKLNLKAWFDGLKIVGTSGKTTANPPKLWQLYFAVEREGKPSPRAVLALIKRAIQGQEQPLGYDVLSAVLSRLRHPGENSSSGSEKDDHRFAPSRMALLRLCLNDLDKGNLPMTESLDFEQNHPAYVCGRMLAEYESLQETVYRAAGESKINLTIADRYYSLASTNPSLAFPKIEQLAKSHFRKLRRARPGAMIAIERRVIELHEKLGARFPPMLSLDGQGRFALGFYHQKAEHNRNIAENAENKTAAKSTDEDQEQF